MSDAIAAGARTATGGGKARAVNARFSPFNIGATLLATVLAILAIYPLARVVLRLFFESGTFDASPLIETFGEAELPGIVGNTFLVVIVSGVIALLFASVLAWILERTDAAMGPISSALPLVPFLVPPIAVAVGWVLALSDRSGLLNTLLRWILSGFGIEMREGPFNIYTWPGLIFIYVLEMIPYAYIVISPGLRGVDPSLEEQARVSGSSPLRTFVTVTLPGIAPSLAAAVLLTVWIGMALFSAPVIVGTGANIKVLSVRIVELLTYSYPPQIGQAVGLSSIIIVTVGLVYSLRNRIVRSGNFMTIGGKGHRHTPIRLGFWKWPARLLVILFLIVSVVVPFVCLLLVALRGFWTPNIRLQDLGFAAFARLSIDGFTPRALINSLQLGVVGGLLGITCAAVVALFVHRTNSGFARALDSAIKVPALLSSIVIGVGFILAFSGPPFNLGGSLTILLLGYLVLYLPQASVAADAAAAQVGRELSEASHVGGAGPGRTFWRISIPLMLPGLVAGWVLLFVRMSGDITLSALLSGPQNIVVGLRVLDIFRNGSYADLAALSVTLALISSVVTIGVFVMSRRFGGVSMH